LKTVLFTHSPGAGEGQTIDIFRAAFDDTLRVCRFRRDAACCGAIACKRASEFDRAGYQLFVQDAVDDGTLEPPRSGDMVLAQIREPTLSALGRYARELAAARREHTVELLQSWLAEDALRLVDFWRKWSAAPRSVMLRAESLAAAPRKTLEDVLSECGLRADDDALSRAAEAAVPPGAEISARTLEADAHFVRPCFVEYLNLLAEEADYLGYPTWQDPKTASGPVTTIYRARRALAERDYENVLAILGPFVAVNAVEAEVRAMLGEALLESGREVEGRRALDVALKARPDYFEAFAILARHAYRLGLTVEGRGFVREAMTKRDGAAWARCFLETSKLDPELLRQFPAADEPAVSRDAVVAGFTWILGRAPESDAVVEGHRRLHDEDDLRLSLLRSQEFRDFHHRFEAGEEHAPSDGEAVTRDDVVQALRWMLGRPLRSREEANDLLASGTRAALRLKLVDGEEFRAAWSHLAESF
jgi:hypothetical protein